MKVITQFPKPSIPGILLLSLLVSNSCAQIAFKIPIPNFLSSLIKSRPHHPPKEQGHPHHHPRHPPQNGHHHKDPHHRPEPPHHHHDDPLHHDDLHHHDVLNHAHVDQKGALYLHDPESTVKFYYKESFRGPSNRVDIHHDGCREVPMDYWYNRPKSLWAKHCITLYQSGHCKGEGVQVAGMVTELRSAGMHYGVNSFKPCEKNIRIKFMPKGVHKHHHHHHSHH